MELTVLGSCGSYSAPGGGGACSGYLIREGGTALWLDCGNGTFANLQRHLPIEDLTAVVVTHEHPDHCVDLFGLHVLLTYGPLRYGPPRPGVPVLAPPGLKDRLGTLVGGDWGPALRWREVDDGDEVTVGDLALRFSRTQHPPPTLAVELSDRRGKRLVYTADTGPGWSVEAFGRHAHLVLSEATLHRSEEGRTQHLSARQAGAAARAAGARALMLTHLWPGLDPIGSLEDGSEAFGRPVRLAAPGVVVRV